MRDNALGATPLSDGRTRFHVWAPASSTVDVVLEGDRAHRMRPLGEGYHVLDVPGVGPGARYRYRLDGSDDFPDPASRRQPEGVHGPSEVVAVPPPPAPWPGALARSLVLYELHVGAFTREGTFDAAIEQLDALAELGITAVELMPIAEVPGGASSRNWGYDGVNLFCVREAYGGEAGLHRFVDNCHRRGLAVLIDVVYNHFGPEGNYLHRFGPWFTRASATPWGEAMNLDGPGSDGVRRHFLQHAIEQFERHGADGLRLDAVGSLLDRSATPFLEELSAATDALATRLGRTLHLVAEADHNDPRWVRPRGRGGLGLSAMWAEDLHHAVHAHFTHERGGYYADFGSTEAVRAAFHRGSFFEGQPSRYRGRRWGRTLSEVPPERLVVYAQNHDQVGNRPDGARLSTLLEGPAHRAAIALALLSPYVPLLFMGQEYGERRPFYFFTSFEDPSVIEGTRAGRSAEMALFEAAVPPGRAAAPPDPQEPATLAASTLDRSLERTADGLAMRALHRAALRLRPALQGARPVQTAPLDGGFVADYASGHQLLAVLGPGAVEHEATGPVVFDSEGSEADPAPAGGPLGRWTGPRILVFGPPPR